jgi:carbonic anhydrase
MRQDGGKPMHDRDGGFEDRDEPMRNLIDGYRRFHSHVFPQRRRFYAKLADGQFPQYLFITCCDSRIDPHEFTQTRAGDLFMERSVGNLVPKLDRGEHESLASIEYAVVALRVEHIIICGHSRCGAIKGLLEPETIRDLPMVQAWLANADDTREAIARNCGHLQGDELWAAAIRENVVVQLGHVSRLPLIARRLEQGLLQTHGWVYEFERGEVVAFDRKSGTFVPLPKAYDFGEPQRRAR